MGYMGGKDRYGTEIAQLIKSYCKYNQTILEPFCGFVNVTQHLQGYKVIASDVNKSLILCLKAIQDGWLPPVAVAEQEYNVLHQQWKEGIESPLIGFVGFGCSWSGKWFGGYARGGDRNYCREAKDSLLFRMSRCQDVEFQHRHYRNIFPKNTIIYCDPPYANTTGYNAAGKWCTVTFWQLMRKWSEDNVVLISEYKAPSDFKYIAEFKHFNSLDSKETIEKVFKWGGK